MRAVFVVTLWGCAASPHFETGSPPVIAPVGHRDADEVRIEVRPSQWYDTDHSGDAFVLAFPAPQAPPTQGHALGAVRSTDVAIDVAAMRCAWQVVPMNEDRPCSESRVAAMTAVQPAIHEAFDDLRVKGGAVGATVVANVACFSTADHMWCEGTALVPDPNRPERVEVDPSQPIAAEPEVATNKLALASDGGVGLLGGAFLRTASLSLRYRPISIAWEIAATHDGRFAVGGSALWRIALPKAPGLDAIVGGEALAMAPNNSVNPQFHGLYEGFSGFMYQMPWKVEGKAQPYVQLRIGAAHGHDVMATPTAPVLGFAIGLSTPER